MPEPASDFIVLGKVVDAYGLQGWLRIHPFGDDPEAWRSMPLWWLGDESAAGWHPYSLRACRMQGTDLLASLEGIGDRSRAESLRGRLFGAPREALPATGAGEYYWADLIGLAVVNCEGASLGEVAGLVETPANAVLRVVDRVRGERLVPFVGNVVLDVDVAAGRIQVDWGVDW